MQNSSINLIEVRVPTFRRPDLLKRALTSLRQQTWTSWRAVVLDDSSNNEGESIVSNFNDPRIVYRPNKFNLGRVDNINQSFRAKPFFAEATHSCVLEDDNWYDPEWLEQNLKSMLSTQAVVLARNYRLINIFPDGTMERNDSGVMADLYGNTPRWLTLKERLLESLCSYTIGNLAYFWKLNSGIDLSMHYEHWHVHVAETGRSVSFEQKCWFEPVPLASFSRFIDKNQTPSAETPDCVLGRRLAKISEINFTNKVCKRWKIESSYPISRIIHTINSECTRGVVYQKLAESGNLPYLFRLRGFKAKIITAKTWLVLLFYFLFWLKENRKRDNHLATLN